MIFELFLDSTLYECMPKFMIAYMETYVLFKAIVETCHELEKGEGPVTSHQENIQIPPLF